MLNKDEILPTFEKAQELSKSYNTIESINILSKDIKKIINNKYLEKFKELEIKEIYNQILLKYYPNETAVKANFINQILMNGKTHVAIYELPILNSRVDLCKINGKSIAYEIKTDLDNFDRLKKQLNDYYQIFDEVYVICSTKKINEIAKIIPKETGIFSYRITKNKKYIFKKERETKKNLLIDSKKQLNILKKNELDKIINNSSYLSVENIISIILNTKNSYEVNKLFKECIKKRYYDQWNFLKQNHTRILEIDYQWFFKNTINPNIIYINKVKRI